MGIIDLLSPEPLDPYTKLTAESVRLAAQKIADQATDELKGEARRQIDLSTRSVVEKTCRILGIKDCCDKNSAI